MNNALCTAAVHAAMLARGIEFPRQQMTQSNMHPKENIMNKIVRTLILAAAVLAGFAGTSYAQLMSNAPQPLPPGVPRG
jgi:hypothetical protein